MRNRSGSSEIWKLLEEADSANEEARQDERSLSDILTQKDPAAENVSEAAREEDIFSQADEGAKDEGTRSAFSTQEFRAVYSEGDDIDEDVKIYGGEKSKNKKEPSFISKQRDMETADLIHKYSSKEPKKDDFSDTGSLRESLAAQLKENKSLLEYIETDKSHIPGEKVEALYKLINEATNAAVSDARKASPIEFDSSRLTDGAPESYKETFGQEQLFAFGDTMIFDAEKNAVKSEEERLRAETAKFDSDYAHLSEKVTGEFEIETEVGDTQMVFMQDEADKLAIIDEEGNALDETDINLRLAFDLMDENRYDVDEFLKSEKQKSRERKQKPAAVTETEYKSREQNPVIHKMLVQVKRKSALRLVLSVILAAVLLYLEQSAPGKNGYPEFLQPGQMLYILIDLQMMFLAALLCLGSLMDGMKSLISRKMTTDTILLMSFLLTTANTLLQIFTDPRSKEVTLYGFTFAVAVVCSCLVNYLSSKKDIHCFKIIASKKSKYAACRLEGNTKEADEFYKYLEETSSLYTVKRTKFISGFFERTKKRPESADLFNILVPTIFIAGLAIFGVVAYMKRDLTEAFSAMTVLVAASAPLSGFFMIALPVMSANRIGARNSTAFIGNAVTEEYADATVLSFPDTEAFPTQLVKITGLRTYGNCGIETIIPKLANVFRYLGGPLQRVFADMLGEEILLPEKIRLIESAGDGICVAMDGVHIFLGKKTYMKRYRFETPTDPSDEAYESRVGSIMYVVLDEEIAAKVYVKYTLNPLFEELLHDMYKAGMCLGVKTLDPNIDNDLLQRVVGYKKCPVAVLKSDSYEDAGDEADSLNSGIVTTSTLHTFLKMFVVCDKARHKTKSNAIITIASVILSCFVVAFLSLSGSLNIFSSLQAVLFQLIWLLPVCITSYLL